MTMTSGEDAALVVRLRNELVHFKPKSLGGDIKHRLTRQLRGKFPDKCLGYDCAKWATTSAIKFADEFFATIDVEPNYQRIEFKPEADEEK